MGQRLDLCMRIGRCAGKCTTLHNGQIRPVVTHRSTLVPAETEGFQGLLSRRALVLRAIVHVLDAQSLQTHPQGFGIPPGNDYRKNTHPLQQLESVAIQCAESLEGLAAL